MTGPRDAGPSPADPEGPSPASDDRPDPVPAQLDAATVELDPDPVPVPLADGISDDRASGRVAVYDTRLLRFLTGPIDPDVEIDDDAVGGRVTRTGRYQLRRV